MGGTTMMKKYIKLLYKYIFNYRAITPQSDFTFINEIGEIEGNYIFLKSGKKYSVKATRNHKLKQVNIRIHELGIKKPKVKFMKSKDFFITRESVEDYIKVNFFDKF